MNSAESITTASITSAPISRVPTPSTDLEIEESSNEELDPAIELRISLISRLIDGIQGLDNSKRRSLIFKLLLALTQIILLIVLLGLNGEHKRCSKLKYYLILVVIRMSLSLPLSIYAFLVPPIPSRNSTPETLALAESQRVIGSQILDRRLRQLSDILSLSSFVIFLFGNIYFFQSNGCRVHAPYLYYGSIISLGISYIYIFEVVLIILAVLFFLPLTLIMMRYFGMTAEKKNEHSALNQGTIDKLPLVIFAGISSPSSIIPLESNLPTADELIVKEKKSPSWMKKLIARLIKKKVKATKRSNSQFLSHSNNFSMELDSMSQYAIPPHPYVTLSENLAACSICLADYELPPLLTQSNPEFELLRKLECSHLFHQECLDSWLVVSGRCPICSAGVVVEKKKKRGESV